VSRSLDTLDKGLTLVGWLKLDVAMVLITPECDLHVKCFRFVWLLGCD
jgi:hypothetical protein